MQLTNIYIRPDPPDLSPRVPFASLKWGQSFRYTPTGGKHQVYFVGPDWITVRREDGWLVRITPDMEGWDKSVITV